MHTPIKRQHIEYCGISNLLKPTQILIALQKQWTILNENICLLQWRKNENKNNYKESFILDENNICRKHSGAISSYFPMEFIINGQNKRIKLCAFIFHVCNKMCVRGSIQCKGIVSNLVWNSWINETIPKSDMVSTSYSNSLRLYLQTK